MTTNIFPNLKSPYVQTTTDIPTVLNLIKNGEYEDQVRKLRSFSKGDPNYEKLKTSLPTFTPNGSFKDKRTNKNIQTLTGLIYLDIDNYSDPWIINQLPYVYSTWKSVGGNGLGVLVSISGLTTGTFCSSWEYLNDYFRRINITLDSHCKDISRQCIVSSDPDIYINTKSLPLWIPRPIPLKKEQTSYTTVTPVKYFSTDTIDSKIKYNTTLDDYCGKDFVVIEEGKDFRNNYIPHKTEKGKRHYWISSSISTIIYNNPSITYERLLKETQKINKDHCDPKLSFNEVKSMVDWSFRKYTEGILKIKTKKKKIWINPGLPLTTHEKRIIVGRETGKLKKQKTIDELVGLYLTLKKQDQKITQKLLQSHSNLSPRTIKKYWTEIMKMVNYVHIYSEEEKSVIYTNIIHLPTPSLSP